MRTRLRTAAVAATGTLVLGGLLGGCGSLPPGAASVVDGTTITRSQVDDLADAQCAGVSLASKQGSGQAVSRTQLTQRALSLLIDIQLNLDYGKSLGLSPRQSDADADFSQVKPLIAALPTKYQADLTSIFERWADGRDMVSQVGEDATGQTKSDSTSDAILKAGYAKREVWLKKSDRIQTDPQYSPGKIGWPGEGSGSVSKPVSSFAKAASSANPSASFIAGLPAGQRCG